jgi:hypothetical protein
LFLCWFRYIVAFTVSYNVSTTSYMNSTPPLLSQIATPLIFFFFLVTLEFELRGSSLLERPSYHLSHSFLIALNFLSDTPTVRLISMLMSVNCPFVIKLCFYWLLVWWRMFNYTLDIFSYFKRLLTLFKSFIIAGMHLM